MVYFVGELFYGTYILDKCYIKLLVGDIKRVPPPPLGWLTKEKNIEEDILLKNNPIYKWAVIG